jgi:hypothetical protein
MTTQVPGSTATGFFDLWLALLLIWLIANSMADAISAIEDGHHAAWGIKRFLAQGAASA